MLLTINTYLQKLMPIITPLSVVIGVLFANTLISFAFLVPWIFAFMSFAGSLNSNFGDLKNVIRHPMPLIACLSIIHVIMPLISLGVGKIAFYDEPYFVTGLILAFLIPTGITSLIWVSIYKGNIVLTLSLILIDTFLAPFIVPAILQFFVGTEVHMNGFDIMVGLLWMIAIPSVLGMALNQVSKGKVTKRLAPNLAPFSKIGLGSVVAINSSAVAPYFKDINKALLIVVIVVFVTAVLGYLIGWVVAKLLKEKHETVITLTYNSGMRNISAGAVIAITYFPAPVALPVVVCMLFQQVLASLVGSLLNFSSKEKRVLPNSLG